MERKWKILLATYKGREQSWVKHYVLKNYLEKLTFKVALGYKKFRQTSNFTLTYIDGFSGPWQSYTKDFSDTSFQIAINQFRAVRDGLKSLGVNLHIRCLFVEKDPHSFTLLQKHLKDTDDIELELRNDEFENIIDFARAFALVDKNSFTFSFIDPTGWTGFGLNHIKPLLQLKNSEVLINFMTKDIIRFIDDPRPELSASFKDLFGINDLQGLWRNVVGREREEAIVEAYRRRIKEVTDYKFVADAVVFNPGVDRSHYHLIYGTRSLEGLLTFRKVEEQAMQMQNSLRNVVKQEMRIERSKSLELFPPEEAGSNRFLTDLHSSFSGQSKKAIEAEFKKRKKLSYEVLLAFLEMPMTYESDLKDWLNEWKNRGLLKHHGFTATERVPKRNHGHSFEWVG